MRIMKNILAALTCMYIVLLPILSQNAKYKGLTAGDIILGLIIMVYLISLIVNISNIRSFFSAIVNFIIDKQTLFPLVLFVIMMLSVTYAIEKPLALKETIRFGTYLILFFILKYGLNEDKYIQLIIKVYFATLTLLSTIGIIQFFTGMGLNKKYIFAYSYGATKKIDATMGNPNSFGAYLIIGLFPLLMMALKCKGIKRVIASLCSLLVFINIILTFSRNAWIGFIIGCVILTLLYNWKTIWILIAFSLTSLFIPAVSNHLKDLANPTQNLSRIKLWGTGWKMIKDHPWFGVGNGNFVSWYDAYVKKYPELAYPDYKRYPVHNSYIKVQSELGVFGSLFFAGFLVISLLRIWIVIKSTKVEFYRTFFMGFIASAVAFLFMNISDNLFFVPNVTSSFWILIALANAILYRAKTSEVGDKYES